MEKKTKLARIKSKSWIDLPVNLVLGFELAVQAERWHARSARAFSTRQRMLKSQCVEWHDFGLEAIWVGNWKCWVNIPNEIAI